MARSISRVASRCFTVSRRSCCFFPPRESQLDLGNPALIKIHAEGHQRQALLLNFARQSLQLFLVQQQPAGAQGVMIHDVPMTIFANVTVMQDRFPFGHRGIGFAQIDPALPERLHFRAFQDQPGFDLFLNRIVVKTPCDYSRSVLSSDLETCSVAGSFEKGGTMPGRGPGHQLTLPVSRPRIPSHARLFLLPIGYQGNFSKPRVCDAPLGVSSPKQWNALVGEVVAAHTWPTRIKFRKLHVAVDNSVWLHQLLYLKATIMETIQAQMEELQLEDIIFRIGELPESREDAGRRAHRAGSRFPRCGEGSS